MALGTAAALMFLLAVTMIPLAIAGKDGQEQPATSEKSIGVVAASSALEPGLCPWEGGEGRCEDGAPVPVAGGAQPMSACVEKTLYHGPCVEMLCTAACLLQWHTGGHCSGHGFLWKRLCNCFVCL
uniref:Knottin scorpion toxin-like domain-containing protein n=1 Tax=Leersia perrieri TaxID=77586 RepID=A0A0D9W472_9ORYZ